MSHGLNGRVGRLERDLGCEGEPALEDFLAELKILDAWLAGRGLTARQAFARGLGGPPGLALASVELSACVEWGMARHDVKTARRYLAEVEARAAEVEGWVGREFDSCREHQRESVRHGRAELARAEAAVEEDERLHGPAPPHWREPECWWEPDPRSCDSPLTLAGG